MLSSLLLFAFSFSFLLFLAQEFNSSVNAKLFALCKIEIAMKTNFILPLFLLVLLTSLSGCELVGDIFQAGMWVGIIVVVAVIGLVLWLVSKLGGRR